MWKRIVRAIRDALVSPAHDDEYISRELFHFVGRTHPDNDEANYGILSKIISSRTVSHPPHNSDWGKISYTITSTGGLLEGTLIEPTITCYSDIPLRSLRIHIEKYGKFGLSFHREPLIFHGARPVTYVPVDYGPGNVHDSPAQGRYLIAGFEAAYRGFIRHIYDNEARAVRSSVIGKVAENRAQTVEAVKRIFEKDFLAFIKTYDDRLPKDHPNNYYMEREWRKLGNFQFTPDQVIRVVVPSAYQNQIARAFPNYVDKIYTI